ncbi:zinc metallopeptidase [Sphingobacterium sp. UT-1RO-CII-1]|uniref:KPN_02809 family neutral zinc metallopeptidase n=1 Tax=Sphingobacterium sp. UT-1RO-CII-1 TaxID=2995225 RepID=UPI00227A54B1|nr:neutral zinc metallopeptidase [Sphingobacterium sp. UT-1RO-CII-1]MCY4778880.1 zinc metallopeptidase [Sphingobacterium sp. UT-1RO-CII-1]
MKWQGARRGGNIEDRRGMKGGKKLALGGIGGIIVLIIGLMMGGDPNQILNQLQEGTLNASTDTEYVSTPEEEKLFEFTDVVVRSTEDVWQAIFRKGGLEYPIPTTIIYQEGTQTAGCGYGESHFGPFYCPADQKIYLDLSFNKELAEKYGAKGEFALAYVIAHEVGHHVQNVLGTLKETNEMRKRLSEKEYNKISVMTELQADFYAGVWAHNLKKYSDIELTYQDIIDGMRAAAAVGDDHLQKQAYGKVNPESFTHGTSEQRVYWFKKGYETGDINLGNTFNDPTLR